METINDWKSIFHSFQLTELRPIPIFNEIKTFEFAGCNFAFSYVDIELAKVIHLDSVFLD